MLLTLVCLTGEGQGLALFDDRLLSGSSGSSTLLMRPPRALSIRLLCTGDDGAAHTNRALTLADAFEILDQHMSNISRHSFVIRSAIVPTTNTFVICDKVTITNMVMYIEVGKWMDEMKSRRVSKVTIRIRNKVSHLGIKVFIVVSLACLSENLLLIWNSLVSFLSSTNVENEHHCIQCYKLFCTTPMYYV